MPPVALITDFGLSDWFAGEMKGAMHTAAPGIATIDITHGIPPGDIRRAAFTLAACYRSFPRGTVFCVVIDPGVGSSRRPIAADTEAYQFVGPDNGVLSWTLYNEPGASIRIIDNSTLFRAGPHSATFHGRDIFGPVAARLAAGLPFTDIGPVAQLYRQLPLPRPVVGVASIATEIITVDRFGNLITAIDSSHLHLLSKAPGLAVRWAGQHAPIRYAEFYQSVANDEALCYPGSAGFVEIAVNGGSAAQRFGLRDGDRIELLIG